jgi:hypothetical protein
MIARRLPQAETSTTPYRQGPYPTIRLVDGRVVSIDENGIIHPRRERLHPPPRRDEVAAAIRWLRSLPDSCRMKTATGLDAYYAKHVMEDATGDYVTLGAFLIACHRTGFMLAARPSDLNAWTGISGVKLGAMLSGKRKPQRKNKHPSPGCQKRNR